MRQNRQISAASVRVGHSQAAAQGVRCSSALRLWIGDDVLIRGCDIVISLLALLFLAPLLLLLSAIIFLADGGHPLFVQQRLGKRGELFRCFKFRSMTRNADKRLHALLSSDPAARAEWDRDHKLRNDPRVTPLGRFLRKSSLDELPQLFNVLLGEMSLVGPRPIVSSEVSRYGSHYRYYCALRPGLTGLWQVSGRNNVSYRRRIACDVLYARRRSTSVNLSILAATVPAVLSARGSF